LLTSPEYQRRFLLVTFFFIKKIIFLAETQSTQRKTLIKGFLCALCVSARIFFY